MPYFNYAQVRNHLEEVFKRTQELPASEIKTDLNWLCSKLKLSIEEAGRAFRENDRLQKEVKALRAKVSK